MSTPSRDCTLCNCCPTASPRPERRPALQEEVVAETRTAATGVIPACSLGKPTTRRSIGVDGSTEPDHHGTEPGNRAGDGKPSSPEMLKRFADALFGGENHIFFS